METVIGQVISLAPLIALVLALIYISGWFSGIETALTHLDSVQIAGMRRRKEKNIEYIFKLKRNMNRTLIAILIGNNVVNIVLSSITALTAQTLFHSIGVTIAIGIVTFLIIIFGEITPKSHAIIHSKIVAQKKARILYYLIKILSPVISICIVISEWILKFMGEKGRHRRTIVTDENIKELVTLGQEEGVIKPLEEDFIYKVLHFGDRKVEDIMLPIKKVTTLSEGLTVEEAIREFKKHSFTRVPVVNTRGRIIGILNMKDLIGRSSGNVKPFLRKPLIVSPRVHLTTLFKLMQEKRMHITVVRDLKHRYIGIVTLEDVLEELVGEIYDEFFAEKYGKKSLPIPPAK